MPTITPRSLRGVSQLVRGVTATHEPDELTSAATWLGAAVNQGWVTYEQVAGALNADFLHREIQVLVGQALESLRRQLLTTATQALGGDSLGDFDMAPLAVSLSDDTHYQLGRGRDRIGQTLRLSIGGINIISVKAMHNCSTKIAGLVCETLRNISAWLCPAILPEHLFHGFDWVAEDSISLYSTLSQAGVATNVKTAMNWLSRDEHQEEWDGYLEFILGDELGPEAVERFLQLHRSRLDQPAYLSPPSGGGSHIARFRRLKQLQREARFARGSSSLDKDLLVFVRSAIAQLLHFFPTAKALTVAQKGWENDNSGVYDEDTYLGNANVIFSRSRWENHVIDGIWNHHMETGASPCFGVHVTSMDSWPWVAHLQRITAGQALFWRLACLCEET